jgi:hypothetical protein
MSRGFFGGGSGVGDLIWIEFDGLLEDVLVREGARLGEWVGIKGGFANQEESVFNSQRSRSVIFSSRKKLVRRG